MKKRTGSIFRKLKLLQHTNRADQVGRFFPTYIFTKIGEAIKMENVIYARLDGLSYENAINKAKQLLNNTGEAVDLTTTLSENDKATTSIQQGDRVIGLLTHVKESYKLGKETREEEFYTVERLDKVEAPDPAEDTTGAPQSTQEPSKQDHSIIIPKEDPEPSQGNTKTFNKAVNFAKVWLLDNFDLSMELPIKLENLPDAKAGYYKPDQYIAINSKLDPDLFLIVLKHELLHYALHMQGLDFTDDSQTFKSFTKVLDLPYKGISYEDLKKLALK